MNKLHFGDNLEILREMDDACVDLICTDLSVFIGGPLARGGAFVDIWTYDTTAAGARVDIEQRASVSDTYKALDECLRGYDLVLSESVSGDKGGMRAYLAFMGPRLAEMHRVLKDTGSIYLHCDPTVSHYLKGLMDAIWAQGKRGDNSFFQNEIVWHYRRLTATSKRFQRVHDIILYYTKTENYIFNSPSLVDEKDIDDADRDEVDEELVGLRREGGIRIERGLRGRGALMTDVWEDINLIAVPSVERLNYPTQKPRVLYERMIEVSSSENDLVLDPFCGSGTTIDAAHTLNRRWIGIDLTILALDPIYYRLEDRHGVKPFEDYEVEGYPTGVQEVGELLQDKNSPTYDDILNWTVTRLELKPTRAAGDSGIDGDFTVWTLQGMEKTDVRMVVEVKAGKPTLAQLRAFCHVMDQNKAKAGVFITIEPVTARMRQEAEKMGTFEHKGLSYPRLQFWQITDEYFENREIINTLIRLPAEWRIRPTRKLEHNFVSDEQLEI